MIKPGIEITLMHGWGFSREVWQNWQLTISDQVIYQKLDRGYFGGAEMNYQSAKPALRTLIVHSFGLHIAPIELFNTLDLLVIISGFSTFLSHSDSDRVAKRTLTLMQRKFRDKPLKILGDFYKSCGITSDYEVFLDLEKLNLDLLEADLQRLETSLFDTDLLNAIPRILLVHGDNDHIVNLSKSQDMHSRLSNSQLFVVPEGQHALPVLNAEACCRIVDAVIKDMLLEAGAPCL